MDYINRKKKDLAHCESAMNKLEIIIGNLKACMTSGLAYVKVLKNEQKWRPIVAILEFNMNEYDQAHRKLSVLIDLKRLLMNEIESKQSSLECPVCYCSNVIVDSPENSPFKLGCKHYLCVECWCELCKRGDVKCPMCRRDLTKWLEWFYDKFENYHEYDSDTSAEVLSDDE